MKKYIKTNGFTVIELLMVSAILVVVFFSAITSFPFIRDQFEFEKTVNDITGIFKDGKFMSMSNKVYPDITDYDNDGEFGTDAILPNGYIIDVNIPVGGGSVTLALYADVFGSDIIGGLDNQACTVCDVFIREVELEEDKNVVVEVYDQNFLLQTPPTTFKVLYDVPEGTFNLIGSPKHSIEFKIEDIKRSDVARDRYIFIHYFQGVPEKFRESIKPI
jgi:prepilin-type N-terminal cleavage/methylation domain-containing protein